MRLLFALPFLVLLTACDPSFMPAGYRYYQDDYKAPTGPDAPSLGYTYTLDDNRKIVEAWQMIVSDLVDRLEEETGLIPQNVYVEPLPLQNAFNATFDHALREELRGRGYTLQPGAADNFYLRYDAFKPEEEDLKRASEHYKYGDYRWGPYREGAATQEDIVLRLTVMRRGQTVDQVRAVYPMPPFGYQKHESMLSLPTLPAFEDAK